MTWILDDDTADETWANVQLREEGDGRLLWLRAGPARDEARWVVTGFGAPEGVRRDADTRELTVADAVALAPEHAQVVLEQTKAALLRMGADDPRGRELADELSAARAELQRQDSPETPDERHPRRSDAPLAPDDYLRARRP